MRKIAFLLGSVLLLTACAPVIEADDVSLSIAVEGGVVLVGEPFTLEVEVAFNGPVTSIGYVVEVFLQGSDPDTEALATASLAGNHVGSFEIEVREAGEAALQGRLRNIDRDGVPVDGDAVVVSQIVSVFAIEASLASVAFSHPPEFWLVDEPFTSEVVLSDALADLEPEVVLREADRGEVHEFDRFSASTERETYGVFAEEKAVNMIIEVMSGPRVLAQSELHSFDVLTPQAMVQKFEYQDFQMYQKGSAQEQFDWYVKTSFPGIFNPTAEQVEQLIADFEDGRYFASSYYFETIRDNSSSFNPQPSDRFVCFTLPDEWPPVPGKHFIYDYDRPFYIGDGWNPAGSDRGSKHLTFFDGRFYRWWYVC